MIIRLKVFLGGLLVAGLIAFFVLYRLEAWLQQSVENSISAMTGTKTDISKLKLNFLESRILIEKLEVASSKNEFENWLELGELIVDFQVLPVLEGRYVIDEFSVKGINWSTPRKSSGFLPKQNKEPSWLDPWIDEAFDQLETEFQELPVARLADFRVPSSPKEVLNNFDLKSEEAFQETVVRVQGLQTQWRSRLKEISDVSEYEKKIAEARRLVTEPVNTPNDVLAKVQTLKAGLEFFKKEKGQIESQIESVKGDVVQLQKLYQDAASAINQDYERALSAISLDSFDLKNLSRVIFGQHWIERIEQAIVYHEKLRYLLAKIEGEDEQAVQIQQRARGRDIHFVTAMTKPAFVLEESEFSLLGFEKDKPGQVSQNYSVIMKGVNSFPRVYDKPTMVNLDAKFKNWSLEALGLEFVLDHRQEPLQEKVEFRMKAFEARKWPIGIDRVLPIKISDGVVNGRTSFNFPGDDIAWSGRFDFEGVKWDLREVPNVGFIIPALVKRFGQISSFYLEMIIKREEGVLSFQVNSDLDRKLQKAIEDVVNEKWNEFKTRLEGAIRQEVETYRVAARKEIDQFQSKVSKELQEKQKLAQRYQNEIEAKIKELEGKAKRMAEEKAKKAVEKQLNQLKDQVKPPKLPIKRLPF